ncbi:MAG: hypothetical protein IPM58_09575 [Nitrospira sp.]|nr:hypothetical protein [Nitrospira sp.]
MVYLSAVVVTVLLVVTTVPSVAATIRAASCSRTHVGDAVNLARNGDTVLVPAGRCTWRTNLRIEGKYFTLRGEGFRRTVIIDGISKARYPNVPQLLWWTPPSGGLARLTGFTFQGGTLADSAVKGIVVLDGASHSFRVDNNKFIPTQTPGLRLLGDLWGVVDHNHFDLSARNGYAIYVHHERYGDQSWAAESSLGTERNVFIENNTFTQDRTKGYFYPAIDGWSGHRIVVRYNQFNAVKVGNHGTETSGRWRSARQFEYYNNTWVWDMYSPATPHILRNAYPALITIRGGTGVVFNNSATITNGSVPNIVELRYHRNTGSYHPWGKCPTVWDLNATRCIDQPGVGVGVLLSGASAEPVGWPRHQADPIYIWNNQINTEVVKAISRAPSVVREGRDFLYLSKPGYAPYAYPHPLIQGFSRKTPSVAPSNFSVRVIKR